jgi:hypothetical protein
MDAVYFAAESARLLREKQLRAAELEEQQRRRSRLVGSRVIGLLDTTAFALSDQPVYALQNSHALWRGYTLFHEVWRGYILSHEMLCLS